MMQSRAALKSFALGASLALGVVLASGARSHAADGGLIRSARSGDWSAPATWEGGKVPGAGARVQIRTGHQVVYDANSPEVIRAVFVGGTLRFAPDRDTRLHVGLLK